MFSGDIAVNILPVFIILMIGFVARRYFLREETPWQMLNLLCYWLLFPALLFVSVLHSDFHDQSVSDYLLVITSGFLVTFLVTVLLCKRLGFSLPVCNSTVQGAGRHNSFLALAVCGTLLGEQGLALATLATAFQVVVTNLFVMTYVLSYTQENKGVLSRWSWRSLLLNQLKNPFLIAIGLAFVFSSFGLRYIPVVTETFELLGRSGLPLSLLATGAGLSWHLQKHQYAPMVIGVVNKMILFPAVVIVLGILLQLPGEYLLVATIYAAVPTAASSYVVARITGGDAPLLSSMTMLQVVISFFSLFSIALWFDNVGLLR